MPSGDLNNLKLQTGNLNNKTLVYASVNNHIVFQVDKTALAAELATSNAITASANYTTSTWSTFTSARTNATTVNNNIAATQAMVDGVYTTLNSARTALVNIAALISELTTSNAIGSAGYSAYTWGIFSSARSSATSTRNNAYATQTQVNTARTNLYNARVGLVVVSSLVAEIGASQPIYDACAGNTNPVRWDSTWNAFNGALASAKTVRDGAYTQNDVDYWRNALYQARIGLHKAVYSGWFHIGTAEEPYYATHLVAMAWEGPGEASGPYDYGHKWGYNHTNVTGAFPADYNAYVRCGYMYGQGLVWNKDWFKGYWMFDLRSLPISYQNFTVTAATLNMQSGVNGITPRIAVVGAYNSNAVFIWGTEYRSTGADLYNIEAVQWARDYPGSPIEYAGEVNAILGSFGNGFIEFEVYKPGADLNEGAGFSYFAPTLDVSYTYTV